MLVEKRKVTIPRLELGISRVSGERVSHCTIQSCVVSLPTLYETTGALEQTAQRKEYNQHDGRPRTNSTKERVQTARRNEYKQHEGKSTNSTTERVQGESSVPGFKDLPSLTPFTYLHVTTRLLKARLKQPDRRLHELRSGIDGFILTERVQLEIHHSLLHVLSLCLHLHIKAGTRAHFIQTQIHAIAHTPLIPTTDPLLYGPIR